MKIIYNVEMSHIKEVVISHKIIYNKTDNDNYELDKERTNDKSLDNDVMPKFMSGKEMADYVRDYVGRKKWKIVMSSGSINIFKKKKRSK